MAVVINASIAAAWRFPVEQAQAAEHVLDILPQTGGVVPGLFRHEIRNILIVNERRGCIDRTQSARFLTRLRNLQLAQDDSHDEDTVLALARNRRLSAYDASYLETALRRGDSLATLDRALARAAAAEGVAVIA